MPTYQCPFCDYDAPHVGSVRAHISASTEGEHEGQSGYESIGGIDDEDLLEDGAVEHDDDSTAEQDDDDSEQVEEAGDGAAREQVQEHVDAEPPETDAGPPSSAPSTDGGSGIVPESESVSTVSHGAEDSADPECPGCGNDETVQSAVAVAEASEDLSEEHDDLLRSSDYVCGECGGVWDDDE